QIGALAPDAKTGVPVEWWGLGTCLEEPIDTRTLGWVGEVDPETGALTKYTGLGRFRHENVALFCEDGKKLRAYLGEDRRGGHVWRFESKRNYGSPGNLLEEGTLYVAKFAPDFSGKWIPLKLDTPLRRPEPENTTLGVLALPCRPEGGPVLVGKNPSGADSK